MFVGGGSPLQAGVGWTHNLVLCFSRRRGRRLSTSRRERRLLKHKLPREWGQSPDPDQG